MLLQESSGCQAGNRLGLRGAGEPSEWTWLVWALLKAGTVLDSLVSLSVLTVLWLFSWEKSKCVLCLLLAGQSSYWNDQLSERKQSWRLFRLPFSPHWGKVVNKTQKAKKKKKASLMVDFSRAKCRKLAVGIRNSCRERRWKYACRECPLWGLCWHLGLAWNAPQRILWCGVPWRHQNPPSLSASGTWPSDFFLLLLTSPIRWSGVTWKPTSCFKI